MSKSHGPFWEIGERLIALREARGFGGHGGQIGFARMLGLTQQQMNNYEKGIRQPSFEAAVAICKHTGATLDWIYRGEAGGLPVDLASRLPQREGPRKTG